MRSPIGNPKGIATERQIAREKVLKREIADERSRSVTDGRDFVAASLDMDPSRGTVSKTTSSQATCNYGFVTYTSRKGAKVKKRRPPTPNEALERPRSTKNRETTHPLAEKVVSAITPLLSGMLSGRSLTMREPGVKHRDTKMFLIGMLVGMLVGVLLVLGLVLLGLKSMAHTTGRI